MSNGSARFDPEKVVVIKSFTPDDSLIQVQVKDFGSGKKFLDIRKFYNDRNTGKLLPSRQGFALDHERFQLIKEIFVENEMEILEALES